MPNLFEEEKISSQDNWHNGASRIRTRRQVESRSSSLEDSVNNKATSSDEESLEDDVLVIYRLPIRCNWHMIKQIYGKAANDNK